jgi:hypothetical protein
VSNELVKLTIEKYCNWLNLWMVAEQSDHRYHPNQFYKYDPKRRLFGQVSVLSTAKTYYSILVLEVSDGDEGGPAVLVSFLQEGNEGWTVHHLVQEFDTNVQSIWDAERGFLSTP